MLWQRLNWFGKSALTVQMTVALIIMIGWFDDSTRESRDADRRNIAAQIAITALCVAVSGLKPSPAPGAKEGR